MSTRHFDQDQNQPGIRLGQMLDGFVITQSIHVAVKLGIADLLAGGPKSIEELASTAGAHPRSLYRLLRALASVGVFAQTDDGRFELTPMAGLLRNDISGSMRGQALMVGEAWYWRPWGELLHSVQTGQPAFDYQFGMELFDYLQQTPQAASTFDEAISGLTAQEVAAVLGAYDFSGFTRIVDVGGGQGGLIAEVLRAHSSLQGVLFDRPEVLEGAKDVVQRAGVAARCELVGGDFFASVPGGGDAYILKLVVHDWDDDRAISILRNCHRAMAGQGKLLIIESEVPPGNEPSLGKILDLHILVFASGLERTEAEYGALLSTAGFKVARVVPTQSPSIIIEAVPV